MYLIDRFSQLLRCEVALHFVNTWDINVLTFDYYWKQLQLPVWIDYQALLLAALHARRIQIPYWAFQELVGSWIISLQSGDYFGTSDYFSRWKTEQSLSAKLWGLYWKTRIEDWGLRIGDWGSGISDSWEGKKKSGFYYYYIKNLTQTISSFISLTTFPFFLNPFMFYLLLWTLHFDSFWWVFVLLQL